MKQRPILFNGAMVRALLNGSKTQTRRIVKPHGWTVEQMSKYEFVHVLNAIEAGDLTCKQPATEAYAGFKLSPGATSYAYFKCPLGTVGDQLWVRETFFAFGRWATRFNEKKGRDEWHFIDMTTETDRKYQYDTTLIEGRMGANRAGVTPSWWKRSSIHMLRRASRITLEITHVRVERLHACNEVDAIAEGAPWSACGSPQEGSHKAGFAQLWESIYENWDANPWVWVIEFKRVTQ